MNALASTYILAHGWRRAGLLVLAGAIAGFSSAPWFIFITLLIAAPALVWALDGAVPPKGWKQRLIGEGFAIGFCFGLGYFIVAIHWIAAAFFVDGGLMILGAPIAVLAIASILALFWAVATSIAYNFWYSGISRIFLLAGLLSLAEFARGHMFTGFPFDILGYSLTFSDAMLQITAVIGVYGLTVIAFVLGFLPALVWPKTEKALTRRFAPLGVIAFILLAQFGFGAVRLSMAHLEYDAEVSLRIVQPNISQDIKWQVFAQDEIVQTLINYSTMSTGPDDLGLNDITHLIWPEAALPFYISEQPQYAAQISDALPDTVHLITGAPRLPYGLDGEMQSGAKPYNSLMAFNGSGELINSYDKTHLVPFGEYLPFQDFFSSLGVKQFVAGNEGWAAGQTRRILDLGDGSKIWPLICYEAVYSGGLGEGVNEANFILVATNDAWFNGSIGPDQHFHHARLRAAEQGKAVVRAANSGVSAVIDPYGRIEHMLGNGEAGVIDASPAQPIALPLFAKFGNLAFWILSLFALGFGGIGWARVARRL